MPTPRCCGARTCVKAYGDATVLNGIDLDVAEHQVVVLIGASGSGKSTLLRCVDLLEDGRRRPDPARRPRHQRPAHRRRRGPAGDGHGVPVVQPVPAHDRAGQRRAGAAGGARVDAPRGRRARPRAAGAGSASPRTPTPTRTSCPAASSSGSRSPARWPTSPRLLLLDEITSALDPELVGEVLTLVGELARGGATIVMATHEMAFAREVADTVCFLDGGRVLRGGAARAGAAATRSRRAPSSSWPG